jgi:TonB family protein
MNILLVPKDLAPPTKFATNPNRLIAKNESAVVKPGGEEIAGNQRIDRGGQAAGGQRSSGGKARPASQAEPASQGESGSSIGYSPGFELSYPKGGQLNLAKTSENPIENIITPNRYRAVTDVNFQKYLRPNAVGATGAAGSGAAGPSGPGGKGRQTRGAKVYIKATGYDLLPWANELLARIQKNWSVAQSAEVVSKGEVGIFVLIAKSGEVLSVEVDSSSKVEAFDQAALRALALSAPFSPLPADFPNSNLEMYFVFQYGSS